LSTYAASAQVKRIFSFFIVANVIWDSGYKTSLIYVCQGGARQHMLVPKNRSGSAILSSSKCFIRKFGVDECKKCEEIVQTKEYDFKSLADVRDEKRIWSL
jgi:hypothetical protein